MYSNHFINAGLLLAFTLLVCSCQKDPISENTQTADLKEVPEPPDHIIGLGKKLQNPYTVTTMQTAYENLKKSKPGVFASANKSDIQIDVTHYYVRFLPKDDAQKES